MDERQKLQSDLTRYRTLRDLVCDEQTIQAIEQLIREAEDRLVQIENLQIEAAPATEENAGLDEYFRSGPAFG
jgi:hypothetical protein